MPSFLYRTLGIWTVFVGVAVVNGAMREKVFTPVLGATLALPLSGILFSLIIFGISYFLIPLVGATSSLQYWLIGVIWICLTLIFECFFGRWVMGKPWRDLVAAYNVLTGNLWILVLATTVVSPYLTAKLRGLI